MTTRRRAGVGLVQLLVVVAIIGILVSLGVGGIRGFLDRGRLAEAVTTLDRQVGDARRIAKRTDQPVVLRLDQVGTSVRVSRDGTQVASIDGATLLAGGGVNVQFDPPFGTRAGADVAFEIGTGSVSAEVRVVGVLARTVVIR